MIEIETAGTNPYAVGEASEVRLYAFNGVEGLTLGQLVNAVCCRVGMALESLSVNKSNIITRETCRVTAFSEALAGLTDQSMTYDSTLTSEGYAGMTVREFLVAQGLSIKDSSDEDDTSGQLPESTSSVADRLSVYAAIKTVMDKLTSDSQQDMVDLQTYVSRRDVSYSTATNIIRTLGSTLQGTAANY